MAMAHGHIWLWNHHIWRPTRQPVTPILLSSYSPHYSPPSGSWSTAGCSTMGSSLPRATPWWPTQATPVLPGGQGQSWGTQRGPSLLARQQQLRVAPCSRVEQQGLGIPQWAPWRPVPIVSASHLLLPAGGQQLVLMGHLLQPAGCAVSPGAHAASSPCSNCLPAMPEVAPACVPRLRPCCPLPIPPCSPAPAPC